MKMPTGAGKTTVMAMLIAWQAVNAVRSPTCSHFSRGFLLIAPGITIKDRLRVQLPDDPENYYGHRDIVPSDMFSGIAKAQIVITNYHAFKRRETMDLSRVGKSLLQGHSTFIALPLTSGEAFLLRTTEAGREWTTCRSRRSVAGLCSNGHIAHA